MEASIVLGAAMLVTNAVWLLVRGRELFGRYGLGRLPVGLATTTATGLGGASLLLQAGAGSISSPPFAVTLLSLGWLSALADSRTLLLPNALTYLMGAELVVVVLLSGLDGSGTPPAGSPWVGVLTSAGMWGVAIAAAHVAGHMGLGDVKLAAVIGGLLGDIPLAVSAGALCLAFLLAGLTAVAQRGGRRGNTSRIPFGPPLVSAAALGWALGTISAGAV